MDTPSHRGSQATTPSSLAEFAGQFVLFQGESVFGVFPTEEAATFARAALFSEETTANIRRIEPDPTRTTGSAAQQGMFRLPVPAEGRPLFA